MATELMSLPALQGAIVKADSVFVIPRMGINDMGVRITKKEALSFVGDMIAMYTPDCPPEDMECTSFGMTRVLADGTLEVWIG